MQIEKTHPVHSANARLRVQPRMILAEDKVEVRESLAKMFARDGFEVLCVDDGDQLLERLRQELERSSVPDLIVMDDRLPGFSGIDLLRALRARSFRLPIILLSSFEPEM